MYVCTFIQVIKLVLLSCIHSKNSDGNDEKKKHIKNQYILVSFHTHTHTIVSRDVTNYNFLQNL